ncbi:MAG: HAAS signaling domain-containing protein [Promethearchaeota archaeon]
MSKQHSKILEEYLNILRSKLPSWILQEMDNTVEEIRTHILDQAEDFAGNDPITEIHIQAAIDEFGNLDDIVNDFNNIKREKESLDSGDVLEKESTFDSHSFLTLKQEVLQLVREKRKKQIYQVMEWILKGNGNMTKEERYSLIGEVFMANPDYFMDKIYKKFQKVLLESYQLNPYDLEQFLMEKLTLLPEEVIQASFQGKLQLSIHVLSGRFYIIGKRLIFHGEIKESVAVLMFTRGLAHALNSAKEEVQSLQIAMGSKYSEKPCFGYQYSLENGHNIRVRGNRVTFNIAYDFQKKYTVKRKEVKVKLTVEEPDLTKQLQTIQLLTQILQN